VIVVAVLDLAREVLIPLALALLFSFLLAPVVRRLERFLGRALASTLVVLAGVAILGAVGVVAANQALSLAARLPEYRQNIVKKIQAVRAPGKGDLGKAAEALKDIEKQAAPAEKPMPVKETAATPHEALADFLAPVAQPLGTAFAVVLLTILILVHRESMRERVIGAIGRGRINLTTQAMGEVAQRVNRYLSMQLVVNALFGVPFATALYFIGVPNAALWGLLGMLLRFIPYAGVWIAAAVPALLAFAISDGWSMLAWTVGAFLAIETVCAYVFEPWLYGKGAGLSPMAVILGTLFWTWLWGPIGLLLSTPITASVAVMGRYLPELGFLNTLLGVEPLLTPQAKLYQRLVALDQEDAAELAEKYVKEHGAAAFYDDVLIPALGLAERDRHAGALEAEAERFFFDNLREIVQEVQEEAPERKPIAACLVAAHDEADQLAAMALAAESGAQLIPHPLLANEAMQEIEKRGCKLLLISSVPPQGANHASYVARRIKRKFPRLKIIVALWTRAENIERSRQRLKDAGADLVVTTFPEALQALREVSGLAAG
jgi:predicted PurR-regulated permease PerM